MIRTISHLAELSPSHESGLADRMVIIDPNNVETPPALNLFDFGLDRLDRYSPAEREKLVNGAIALYEYVFGALLGAELTQRQGVIFRYLARLLMVIPGATIHTLRELMEEPEATRAHFPRLDPLTRHFFESQFLSKSFDDTRRQILTRLGGILSNSVLARMFSHERNRLNLFEAMNEGRLILINTAKDLLKQDGCAILELGSLTCRQAAALVGVAPFSRDSGRMRGRRTVWGGRAALRACLYMAAVAAARGSNPAIAGFYRRLRLAGKPAKHPYFLVRLPLALARVPDTVRHGSRSMRPRLAAGGRNRVSGCFGSGRPYRAAALGIVAFP